MYNLGITVSPLFYKAFVDVLEFPCKYKGFIAIVNRKMNNSLLFFSALGKIAVSKDWIMTVTLFVLIIYER
jgi:hypothetical protein